MKRLLAQIGLTYLSVLAIVFYFGKTVAVAIAVLSLMIFVLFLSIEKYRKTIYLPVMAFVAIVACLVNLCYTSFVYEKTIEKFDNKSGIAVVTLKEEPTKWYDSYCYRFECSQFNGEECDFSFVAYSEFFYIDPFDTVELEVELSKTHNNSNLSKKCFFVGDFGYGAPDYKFISYDDKSLYALAIKMRQAMREALDDTISGDAFSLCSALLLGDKHALSDELRQAFTNAGVSHLIVVSGMHFSVLASVFFFFTRKFYGLRFVFIPFAIVFILFYMAITGYTPSVMRSGVMLLIYAFGMLISRESYSPNSLGVAALVVSIFNPYVVGDVGLILSFASTFSIVCFAPNMSENFQNRIKNTNDTFPPKSKTAAFVHKKVHNIKRTLVELFCVGVCAYAATLPISILFFESFSTIAVLSTFVLSIPIDILLIISFVITLVYFIPLLSFVLPVLSFVVEILTGFVINTVYFVSGFEFSYIHNTYDFVYLFIVFALVLFLMYYVIDSEDKGKLILICITTVFLFSYLSAVVVSSDISQLYVYDVQNGSAVLYSSGNTSAMLSLDCSKSDAYKTINKLENTVCDIDFYSCAIDTVRAHENVPILTEAFAIDDILVYTIKNRVDLSDTAENVITPVDVTNVRLNENTVVSYVKTGEKYIIYLDTIDGSVLVVDKGIDVLDIPEKYRTADTIVLSECTKSFELLSCKTLILSIDEDYAYNIMKQVSSISQRVLLSCEGDIRMIM